MIEHPEGIIITIGAKMYGDKEHGGYRRWLRNFLQAMDYSVDNPQFCYWFRQGNQPKASDTLQYVYLCIGGKIRYRCFFAGSRGACSMQFENHTEEMFGKAWVMVAGPVERAPFKIEMKGFQGFRYTHKLF